MLEEARLIVIVDVVLSCFVSCVQQSKIKLGYLCLPRCHFF